MATEELVYHYVTDLWWESYDYKPDWWDNPTEPRCDGCGIHTEDAFPFWCGECGSCNTHCTCPSRNHERTST